MTEARRMALRAIELDEHLAEAHASLGHVYTQLEHRWDDADRCYEKALALKPGYAQAWMWQATNATYRRRMPLALEHIRHAQSLEPMSLTFASIAGMIMYFARDFDGARDQLSRMVETVPDAPLPRHLYARVLLALGEAENVVAMLEGDSTRGPFCLSNLGRAYAMCGMRDAALAEIARVRALGERGYGVGYDLAQIFVALGEHEAAVEALERAVDDGSQTVAYFESDIAVDPIRDDPRLRTVARRLGLPLP
jgi:tetratricopeptide (TPR) repeat protein